MLNFWASWCEPCRTESPLLERWHRRISQGGRGTVLGIDGQDVSSDAREFVRDFELSYPMLHDGPGDLREPFGVLGYPETFVIDARGRVAAVQARAGERRVHARHGHAAARGSLVRRAAAALAATLALLAVAPAALAADCPKTTLGDVEDEVMCPVCGTPLELATEAPQAQRERDVHPSS